MILHPSNNHTKKNTYLVYIISVVVNAQNSVECSAP